MNSFSQMLICSVVYFLCDSSKRQQIDVDSVRKVNEENTVTGHVQVTLVDDTVKQQETTSGSRSEVRDKSLCCFQPTMRLLMDQNQHLSSVEPYLFDSP